MKSKLSSFLLFIIISALGVLLHFTFEWSGNNPVVGYFSAVSESTWEHLKLLFFPMVFITICQCIIHKDSHTLLTVRSISIPCGMLFIVVVFYTVWGVMGKLMKWLNIGIYFLSVAFVLFLDQKLTQRNVFLNPIISVLILGFITLLFFFFTYHAPNLGIFHDLEYLR
ncbi:MAG: DUF6512 family protein [Lachnospiraceae bacterium]|nr:DUF6512 family protein [Lachnospiraceae bacterium]